MERAARSPRASRWSTDALARAPLGPYQLQAAIAAVHAEATAAEDTDWPQIVALYALLERIAPNPMVTLNHAVGGRDGRRPTGRAGAAGDARRTRSPSSHRLVAVRAHLLELAGDGRAARVAYLEAARRTTSLPERRHLEGRAAMLV